MALLFILSILLVMVWFGGIKPRIEHKKRIKEIESEERIYTNYKVWVDSLANENMKVDHSRLAIPVELPYVSHVHIGDIDGETTEVVATDFESNQTGLPIGFIYNGDRD